MAKRSRLVVLQPEQDETQIGGCEIWYQFHCSAEHSLDRQPNLALKSVHTAESRAVVSSSDRSLLTDLNPRVYPM